MAIGAFQGIRSDACPIEKADFSHSWPLPTGVSAANIQSLLQCDKVWFQINLSLAPQMNLTLSFCYWNTPLSFHLLNHHSGTPILFNYSTCWNATSLPNPASSNKSLAFMPTILFQPLLWSWIITFCKSCKYLLPLEWQFVCRLPSYFLHIPTFSTYLAHKCLILTRVRICLNSLSHSNPRHLYDWNLKDVNS